MFDYFSDIKSYYLSFVISFNFDILRRITTFSVFIGWCKMTSLLKLSSDVTFNVACELSQPMGKTEFSSTAKNRTNSVS